MMKTLKNTIKLMMLGLFVQLSFADPGWDGNGDGVLDNYNDYENNGSVTAKVYPDGVEGGALGDMIAVFHNEELRGVGCASEVPIFVGVKKKMRSMIIGRTASKRAVVRVVLPPIK